MGQYESNPGPGAASQTGIYESPAQLSSQIIKGKSSDIEKVTAIFHWIAGNISYYRPQVNQGRRKKTASIPQDDPPDDSHLPSLTERIATKVIKDRRAVCEGYARLFTSLCDHAGIQSAIITGYARTKSEGHGSKFRSNHTWNAVNIDGKWKLLDVTWASGFVILPSGEFVRQYDPYYFLTDPAQFIQHHYPDDLRWSLLENPPVIPEFRYTPFRQRSFSKYSITSFYPSRGIIETNLGDTIRIELETMAAIREGTIAPDSLWDSIGLQASNWYAIVKPASQGNSRVFYNFPVSSENIQWLYVLYNNDAVLRYRINIKKAAMQGQ